MDSVNVAVEKKLGWPPRQREMERVLKFPDAGSITCVYYPGLDSLLLRHRTSGDSLWVNGGDMESVHAIFDQVLALRERLREERNPTLPAGGNSERILRR